MIKAWRQKKPTCDASDIGHKGVAAAKARQKAKLLSVFHLTPV